MRGYRAIALGLSALVLAAVLQVAVLASPAAATTYGETTGGVAHTWTNYTNAGGTQGPSIAAFQTVQITCALTGFRVADGNTWWYQIASSPWNNIYYVSADAFYNNGATSGSLIGTPFVDTAVPTCASLTGGTSETTGGAANTWTNYTNAGGTQGPTIASHQTVQIACALTGFRVADGNTWWYRIASAPWTNLYYVSADAFYNNGATSGSLVGTPFVDPAVPLCSTGGGGGGPAPHGETAGGAANTWTNYTNAGGTQGPTIPAFTTVQIACKLTGFRVADGNTWWYQIASSPWNNAYYVSADAFYNNGATSGSLVGTPFVDSAVPDCAPAGQPRPSGETTGGATSTFGNYSHAGVTGPSIPAFTTVQVACRVTGFRVADGNTWWYLVSSSPWNSLYYASADAFYNNGQTSGSLIGTPFVDTAVPICVNNREAPIYFTAYGSSSSSSHASSHSTSCLCGDPVNTASGDFYEPATDVSIPGRGAGLKLVRTYNDLAVSSAGLFGNGWSSTYDQHLTLNGVDGSIQVTFEDGSQVIAQPDGSGGFTLPASSDSTLVHNNDGTYTLTQRRLSLLQFSATGQLIALRDLNGNATTLGYGGAQLSTVTDAAGRVLHVAFGSNGFVSSVTDPLGRTTSYGYDGSGNLTSVTNPLSQVTSYGYDSSSRMTTVTDARGGVLTNVYDSQGRVTSQTDATGQTTTFAYTGDNFSSVGGTTTMTDPRGTQEVLQYANGFLTRDIKASGTSAQATWIYNYDPSTFGVVSSTDPNGNVTTHTYDGTGHVLTTTDPLNHVTTYTYNGLGEVLTTTSPLSEVTRNTYDANGNLLSTTGPVGDVTTYTHGDATHPGDVTSVTDPDGRLTEVTYDGQGDLATTAVHRTPTITDTTQFVYDADGEQVCKASPNAVALSVSCPPAGSARVVGTTTTAYDARGEVLSVTDPNGHTTTNSYDGNGNKSSATDAANHTTTYTYDADNRLTKTTEPNSSANSSTYDGNGNVATTTDANGHVTTNNYDPLNRLTSTTNPLGQTTAYTYDANGNRTSLTDAATRVTSYTYDAANEQISISYSDGVTHGVSFAYDADGHRTSMTDGTGTTNYTYDAAGRLATKTDGAGSVISYLRDKAGHTTALTYPNGKTVTETYDGAGNLTSITDWLGHASRFAYDGDQNVTSQTTASSPAVTDTYGYDANDQLTSIRDTVGATTLQGFSYTRTPTNLVASATPAGGSTGNYTYDPANQLAHDSQGTYAYDPTGNPTTLLGATQAFNSGDELTNAGTGALALNYTYDQPGSRTSRTSAIGVITNYGYDQSSRLTAVTSRSILPTVAQISPATGPVTGSTTVTITGAGFTGTTAVQFGGHPAHFSVVSDTSISATAPAGSGIVDVTVTRGVGTSNRTTSDRYTYTGGPVISSISPTSMGTTPNMAVTLIGSGLTGTTAVWFGPHQSTHVSIISNTKLVATAPNGTGAVNIRVVKGTTSSPTVPDARFAYAATKPAITHITPNSGSFVSHTTVTILGSGFSGTTAVHFGAAAAMSFHVVSDGVLSAVSPTGSGAVDITVTNPVGTSTSVAADRYMYLPGGTTTTARYGYNGDGLRATKTIGYLVTKYAWDTSGDVPLLLSDGTTNYIYGPGGLPIESVAGTTVEFFHHDQLGSTTMLTSATGIVLATFSYSSFGALRSGPTNLTPLLYNGQYRDPETGLYYLRARYYDPAAGQFLTVDPALATTRAPYSYASNDPVNSVDPTGLWPSKKWFKFFWNELPPVGAWNSGYQFGHDLGTGASLWNLTKDVGHIGWNFVPVAPFVDWFNYYQGTAGEGDYTFPSTPAPTPTQAPHKRC
jgi:RHS repeat-associated protein